LSFVFPGFVDFFLFCFFLFFRWSFFFFFPLDEEQRKKKRVFGRKKRGFFSGFFFTPADAAGFGERREFLGERKLAGDVTPPAR
jgi:hypothetical protein